MTRPYRPFHIMDYIRELEALPDVLCQNSRVHMWDERKCKFITTIEQPRHYSMWRAAAYRKQFPHLYIWVEDATVDAVETYLKSQNK